MRTKAMGLLLLIAASAWLAYLLARPGEPTYKGRLLSYWIARYETQSMDGPDDNDSGDAIRAIGTNAVPFLRRWAAYNPPAWPPWLRRTADRVIYAIYGLLGVVSQAERSDAAIFAFTAFRTNAEIAVPELTQLLKDHPMAIDALGRLGNQALPPLLNAWSNSVDKNDRWRIQYAVVINLKPDVRNTNLVPLLLATISQNRQQSIRLAASNALFQIAPDLRTNAPPQ